MGDKKMVVPPGFQFDPTDEELIVYFLCRRVANLPCHPNLIPDLDFHAANPWELNETAFSSKGEWYFFSRLKQNRSTRKGFWKEVGLGEPIFTRDGDEIGMKKYHVFYGVEEVGSMSQANWTMEEYHLPKFNAFTTNSSQMGENQIQDMNELVLCRVHEANFVDCQEGNYYDTNNIEGDGVELSYLDEVFFSMEDEQEEITFPS